MAKMYEGYLVSQNLKYGIVVGRFNEFITSKLLSGAQDALKRHGVQEDEVEIFAPVRKLVTKAGKQR